MKKKLKITLVMEAELDTDDYPGCSSLEEMVVLDMDNDTAMFLDSCNILEDEMNVEEIKE